MAAFKRGDRVIATRNIGDWGVRVQRGTEGEVIRVDEPWMGADTFTVRFGEGSNLEIEEGLREEDLYPA